MFGFDRFVANNIDTLTRVGRASLLAASLALLTPAITWAGACSDMNDNGTCDAGDPDVTAQVLDDGVFFSPHSITVDSAGLSTGSYRGLLLISSKNITANGPMTASHIQGRILLMAQNGSIDVGDGAHLRAASMVYFRATQNITVGAQAEVDAYHTQGLGYVYFIAGSDIECLDGAMVHAFKDVYFSAGGEVVGHPGTQLGSGGYRVSVVATGNISMSDGYMSTKYLTAISKASMLDFQGNQVQIAAGGMCLLAAQGPSSVVNTTGSQANTPPIVFADTWLQ